MATKIGLSYYTVDTDRYLDIRIKRLRKDYGCRGLAVYDYVLCEIYRVKGCFVVWDESTAFDVAEYFALKESVVQEIVKYCAAVGLFNEALLRRGIVTSASIQRRYLEMATRAKRKSVTIPPECRIPEVGLQIPEVETPIRENSGNWAQSKGKKSKKTLSLTPSLRSGAESAPALPTDEEREEFYRIFFLKNFHNPRAEADRFIAFYQATGWRRKGVKIVDRAALAQAWTEQPTTAPPRFPAPFMAWWGAVYRALEPTDDCGPMFDDLHEVQITPGRQIVLTTRTPGGALRDFIERHLDVVQPLFGNAFPGHTIHYRVPRK